MSPLTHRRGKQGGTHPSLARGCAPRPIGRVPTSAGGALQPFSLSLILQRMVINKRVLIAAVLIAIVLVVYGILTLNGVNYRSQQDHPATAYMTLIAPGAIPTQDLSLLQATPTATVDPALGDLKGIQVGKYVQISGTGGAGLNVRADAGLNGKMIFLASESEAFRVIDGPVSQDNLIWWKLSTPYDNERQGWAAADYLALIQGQ